MDLSLNEGQQMLQQVARGFMEREAPKNVILSLQSSETGCNAGIWNTAAQLGWLGMLVPREYGGDADGAGSLTDAAVLYEELGRGPLGGPFFSSGVLGALTVLEAATEQQRCDILPRLAGGSLVLSVAISEPGSSWGPRGITLRPTRSGDTYRLDGAKLFVSDAIAATHLLVAIRTGDAETDISLLLVDKQQTGVAVRNLPGFIGWQSEVRFDGVEIAAERLLGLRENDGWNALERAFERAIPVLCAYAVGGCQAVFEMSVRYSQTRVQFGVPIGRFQRVQDHIIRLVNHLDAARWTTYEALSKIENGRPARAAVHMAKAVAGEAYLEACNAAHEVHAGVGSAHEYGLTPHTQMSRSLFHQLGDPKWHKRRLADALGW